MEEVFDEVIECLLELSQRWWSWPSLAVGLKP
jgi:hypothetical protein